MKHIFIILSVFALSGCYGMADYRGPPPGATGTSAVPTDPETVRADPTLYPKFRVSSPVQPPSWVSQYDPNVKKPMVDIFPSDIWTVRHVIENLFVITSETYDARQNLSGGKFSAAYINGLFIMPDGHVSGGWILLHNPRAVILPSDRRTYLMPSSWGYNGWEKIRFEKTE